MLYRSVSKMLSVLSWSTDGLWFLKCFYFYCDIGAKLIFELSANRQLTFSNITIQNGGTLELKSNFANETDIYELQVWHEPGVNLKLILYKLQVWHEPGVNLKLINSL